VLDKRDHLLMTDAMAAADRHVLIVDLREVFAGTAFAHGDGPPFAWDVYERRGNWWYGGRLNGRCWTLEEAEREAGPGYRLGPDGAKEFHGDQWPPMGYGSYRRAKVSGRARRSHRRGRSGRDLVSAD
jgi:hypothetical protein